MQYLDFEKQGDNIFTNYAKESQGLFQPQTVQSLYGESVNDLKELNNILHGRKAPVKSLAEKVNNFFKDMFVDKKGIIEKMSEKLEALQYCLSDVEKMQDISKQAYSGLVEVVNNNYDTLLDFSKSVPNTKDEVWLLKEEIGTLREQRALPDTSDEKAVEIGKELFQRENEYKNKLHELSNKNEQVLVLQNFLQRNKDYASTIVDVISFYERAFVVGMTIAYQMKSHLSSLKAGAQLVVNVSDLDEISGEVMELANNADDVWARTYDKIVSSGNISKKLYNRSSVNSMNTKTKENLTKMEKQLSVPEQDLSTVFRKI
jgi:hypothetical protein